MKRRLIASLVMALVLIATMSLPALAVEESSVTASVTVGEVISITLVGSIGFGSVTPPITDQGTSGQVDGSPAVRVNVGSETNVHVDIGIKGAIASGSLALTNWKYSKTFSDTKTSIPSNYTAVYTDALASSSNFFYHWITVPADTVSGTHTITVYYKAVKTGTSF